jgi:hypothetical protein
VALEAVQRISTIVLWQLCYVLKTGIAILIIKVELIMATPNFCAALDHGYEAKASIPIGFSRHVIGRGLCLSF